MADHASKSRTCLPSLAATIALRLKMTSRAALPRLGFFFVEPAMARQKNNCRSATKKCTGRQEEGIERGERRIEREDRRGTEDRPLRRTTNVMCQGLRRVTLESRRAFFESPNQCGLGESGRLFFLSAESKCSLSVAQHEPEHYLTRILEPHSAMWPWRNC